MTNKNLQVLPENLSSDINTIEANQSYLDSLSKEQKTALINYIIKCIQVEVSSKKAILKDLVDAGVGIIPVAGDIMQIIITLHLLYCLKTELKEIDNKTLAIILGLTATDVSIGLFVGPGDVLDFPMLTNYFIQQYLEHEKNKAYLECINQEISDTVLATISKSPLNFKKLT
jgi:hypothetical protein